MKTCKYCGKEIERITGNRQEYHKECAKEVKKKREREYNKKHKGEIRKKRIEYYKKHKEKIKKYHREKYIAVPTFGKGKPFKGQIKCMFTDGVTKELKKLIPEIKNKVLNDAIEHIEKYLED